MKISNILAACAIATMGAAAQAGGGNNHGHHNDDDGHRGGSHDYNGGNPGDYTGEPLFIMGNSSSSTEMSGAQFTGTIEYEQINDEHGYLRITLNNTTSQDIGGYLTGFVFDIAGSDDDDLDVELDDATIERFRDTGEAWANPFGEFDAGAALRANWNGGGNPHRGIGVGETGVFEFKIETDHVGDLTTASFLGDSGNRFAARFRGLDDGGSDKLLVVPVPTALLAGAGMLGLCLGVRTARRRA